MRRSVELAILALLVTLVGCSSGSPLAVEFSVPQVSGARPFIASGIAVDDGVVCPGGSMNEIRLESIDGDEIAFEDWAAMFNTGLDTGGVAEMNAFQRYTCGDGSGTFTFKFHFRLDFATFEFEGQQEGQPFEGPQDVGSWEIEEGTGSYSNLTGSGDVTMDFDAGEAIYSGEIETN